MQLTIMDLPQASTPPPGDEGPYYQETPSQPRLHDDAQYRSGPLQEDSQSGDIPLVSLDFFCDSVKLWTSH
jgi:hypothetical protein